LRRAGPAVSDGFPDVTPGRSYLVSSTSRGFPERCSPGFVRRSPKTSGQTLSATDLDDLVAFLFTRR
jgi:hypothetical protein